jgi:hypothetical protein
VGRRTANPRRTHRTIHFIGESLKERGLIVNFFSDI